MQQLQNYQTAVLIDDSFIDNFVNEQMLEAASFARERFVATDGQLAIQLIHALISGKKTGEVKYPDILFVDLNMPVMDGLQFIKEFQNIPNERLKKCRIIVLTSSIHRDDKESVRLLGPTVTFTNKPLSKELLKQLLEDYAEARLAPPDNLSGIQVPD